MRKVESSGDQSRSDVEGVLVDREARFLLLVKVPIFAADRCKLFLDAAIGRHKHSEGSPVKDRWPPSDCTSGSAKVLSVTSGHSLQLNRPVSVLSFVSACKFQGSATQASGAVRQGVNLRWLVILRDRVPALHSSENRQHCYELANALEPALCHGPDYALSLFAPSDSSALARATRRMSPPAPISAVQASGRLRDRPALTRVRPVEEA